MAASFIQAIEKPTSECNKWCIRVAVRAEMIGQMQLCFDQFSVSLIVSFNTRSDELCKLSPIPVPSFIQVLESE